MFFFERVKTGEPGEVSRSKCGEGRRETNRVWVFVFVFEGVMKCSKIVVTAVQTP